MNYCKYPNEVCKNMTLYDSVILCDSMPCNLKDETDKEQRDEKEFSVDKAINILTQEKMQQEFILEYTDKEDWRQKTVNKIKALDLAIKALKNS